MKNKIKNNINDVMPSGVPKKKLTIGVDVDDTLVKLMSTIASIVNKERGLNLTVDDFSAWGLNNHPKDLRNRIFELFKDEELYSKLPLMEGAQDFIKEISSRGHRVVIVSATLFESMSARAIFIKNNFPEIHSDDVILTGSKDLVNLDMLFDDKIENIEYSSARVPVLVNQPWNKDSKGYVVANSVYDYLEIVNLVEEGYNKQDIYRIQHPTVSTDKPLIITLTGNSGSGKTTIANSLTSKDIKFKKVVTSTTRNVRDEEIDSVDYNFYTLEEFNEKEKSGAFVETTTYLGNKYGVEKEEIEKVLRKNLNAVIVLEENGVRSIKDIFPNNNISIFVNRSEDIITSILERNVSTQEKEERVKQLFLENDILHSDHHSKFSFAVKKIYDYNINNDILSETVSNLSLLFDW